MTELYCERIGIVMRGRRHWEVKDNPGPFVEFP
jgi:hypothetical protein